MKIFEAFCVLFLFRCVSSVAVKKVQAEEVAIFFPLPNCPGPYPDFYPPCPPHQVYCCPPEHTIRCVNGHGFGTEVCERFKLECGLVEHTSGGGIRCVL